MREIRIPPERNEIHNKKNGLQAQKLMNAL